MPVFILAWHPAGAPRRRYQVQVCDDTSRAAELAAGLARSDGGGRWVVFGTVTRTRRNGSTATERDAVVAKGTEPPTAGGYAGDTTRPGRRGRRGATRR